jgi:hypothetical protein
VRCRRGARERDLHHAIQSRLLDETDRELIVARFFRREPLPAGGVTHAGEVVGSVVGAAVGS